MGLLNASIIYLSMTTFFDVGIFIALLCIIKLLFLFCCLVEPFFVTLFELLFELLFGNVTLFELFELFDVCVDGCMKGCDYYEDAVRNTYGGYGGYGGYN